MLSRRAALATSFGARLRGLLGRRGWRGLDGIWIEPCAGVHSLGMRFSIDVLLVDDAMTVVALLAPLRPWRLGAVHLEAAAALEVPVGTVDRTGTQVGDALALEE